MSLDVVKPADDPQIGNLATPINSSDFTKALINNLPAYRAGLSAQRRGLEIGMAHGYFLFGPFAYAGPYRDTSVAAIAGLIGAASLVVLLTIALSLYASTLPKKPISTVTTPRVPDALASSEGWSEFASNFLIGGVGGAAFAFLLFEVITSGTLDAFGHIVP